MPKKSAYDANNIEILEDLEHIRLRPSQYIGDTGIDGLHHLLKEVIDNAVDEYMDGHVSAIGIKLDTETQTVVVIDDGRGIPVSIHPKAGVSTITAIFTKLHSGGKFGRGAYTSATGGLHGVGIKATNALSEQLTVWTNRRGKVFSQEFKKGEPTTKVRAVDNKLKKGTVVKFKPDFSIFKKVKFDPRRVRSLLRDISYLCPGLKIELRVDQEPAEVFYSKNGLTDMLVSLMGDGVSKIHEEIITVSTAEVDAVFAWTDRETGELWKSFVNVVPTTDHGTHVQGAKKAIQQVLSDYVDKKVKVKDEDLRDGLIGIVHAHVKEPEFRGQTKTKLGNTEVETLVATPVETALRKFATGNSQAVKSIVERAAELFNERAKFRARQKAIRSTKVKQGARGILPGKLCEAPDCDAETRELYIVEGDSAFGTVKNARILSGDKVRKVHYQEVLPLRGKVMNAAKKGGLDEVLKNSELSGVTQALGTGIGPAFDLEKCRYKAIYLLMDADPDGKHILALLLSFFAQYLPRIIEDDKLRVVLAPLFMGVTSTTRVYGDTIEEVKTKLGKATKFRLARFKGLGESSALDLRAYAMDARTRNICRVLWNGKPDQDLVLQYMGDDSTARKILLNITSEQ